MRRENTFDLAVLWAAGSFYGLNRFWLSRTVPGAAGLFLRCWANDVVAGAAILCWLNLLLSLAGLGRVRRWVWAALFLLACGLVWECAAPLWKTGAVFDPLDLLAYQLGGAASLYLGRRIEEKTL